ncbi:putative deacetylvindoline O-acetyltransferase-like isoform X2 [Capsicum annuum]|nr:putative deacetylvindoline O-acetyltransferase-like isoform X2 [Capsicum annuum]
MLSIISKKIIKPFTPAPSTQRWHKLSLIDQFLTHYYMPFVFFYSKNQVNAIPNGPKQILNLLTDSLSKALSHYCPWAGSLKDNATIECDDHGAEFLEVQINSTMDKVANHPDSNVNDSIFPRGLPWGSSMDRALTVAQLNHFDCGGIALSVCMSHKVGDASSVHCFLRDWAALTRSSNTIRPSPYFVEDSILPSPIGPLVYPVHGLNVETSTHYVQKRFIFSSTKLSALKSSIEVQNVTSNEAVSALLYKCAASSATVVNSGLFKRSQLVQFSDLRQIISPRLPPNSIGNLLTVFSSPIYHNEEELKLPKLITDIRKSINNLSTRNNVEENELAIEMLHVYRTGMEPRHKRKCDVYISSSICKFPLIQDLDFGFGKPIRASIAKGPFDKNMVLMKTYDGGIIEVFICLNEEEMCVFEHDKHLLEFATPAALTYYYPWAGRLKDNAVIECDDHGAEFLEVQISSPMDKVVNHPDSNVKDMTFPQGVPWGDGSSVHCFLRDWASLTRSTNTIRPSPFFVEDSILQSPIGPLVSPVIGLQIDQCVQKRFIFSSTKLSALKSSIDVQNVTSNEAVNALLYKCAAFSACTVNSGSFKRSQLIQFSDLRAMISLQLPPNSIGNLITAFSSPIYDNKEELKLPKLITDIRKSKNNFSARNNIEENEYAIEMLDAYRTRMEPFRKTKYLDFRFGKPIRASIAKRPLNKYILLMRTYDGGIEALVNLDEQEMSVFEHDEHLLQFATPVG